MMEELRPMASLRKAKVTTKTIPEIDLIFKLQRIQPISSDEDLQALKDKRFIVERSVNTDDFGRQETTQTLYSDGTLETIIMPLSASKVKLTHPLKLRIDEAIDYHAKQGERVGAIVLRDELFPLWVDACNSDGLTLVSNKDFDAFGKPHSWPYYVFCPELSEEFFTFSSDTTANKFVYKKLSKLSPEEKLLRRRFPSLDRAEKLGFYATYTLPVFETEFMHGIPVGKREVAYKQFQLKEFEVGKLHFWHYQEV